MKPALDAKVSELMVQIHEIIRRYRTRQRDFVKKADTDLNDREIDALRAHVGETNPNEAVTEGGKLRPASRAAALIRLLKGVAPLLAISGRTMEFDGAGRCTAGC